MNPNFSAKASVVDAVPQVYSVQEVHALKQTGVAPQKGARDLAFASELRFDEGAFGLTN
jgi:hypothetical protein